MKHGPCSQTLSKQSQQTKFLYLQSKFGHLLNCSFIKVLSSDAASGGSPHPESGLPESTLFLKWFEQRWCGLSSLRFSPHGLGNWGQRGTGKQEVGGKFAPLTQTDHHLRTLDGDFFFSTGWKKQKTKTHPATPYQVLLPSETLAGTALRSIQKDTQDSMTIRVAGK